MPLPTPNKKPGFVSRLFTLPADLSPYLDGVILELSRVGAWQQLGDRTPSECAEHFDYLPLEQNMIGSIFSTLGQKPDNALWLDGSIVNAVDYPMLASVIDPQFLVGEIIVLPDLTGYFLFGGDVIGVTGGEETHTLTEEEMPAHNHGEHTHLPIQASGELPTQVPDIPVPDLFASRGGGLPHNNMPPYFTVRYYIIAG